AATHAATVAVRGRKGVVRCVVAICRSGNKRVPLRRQGFPMGPCGRRVVRVARSSRAPPRGKEAPMFHAHVRSRSGLRAVLRGSFLCSCGSSTHAPARGAENSPPAQTTKDAPASEKLKASAQSRKVVGYFTNWVENRKGCEFHVRDVDPSLFSHINFAFAQVD